MGASWVHGITDRDVRNAPTFEQIAEALLFAISGCVIAAHNEECCMGSAQDGYADVPHASRALPIQSGWTKPPLERLLWRFDHERGP